MTRLDPRLRAVAAAVRPGAVTADIGADHGQLICALVAAGKCPRGYASDIGALPLQAARRNIQRQGLGGCVKAVLSDGLRGLPGQAVDDVVVAGMGGELIGEILLGVPWTRDPDKRFVLQPMTRAEHLRRLLYREGFALLDETAVCAGRFVYTVMSARFTGRPLAIDEHFAYTGLVWGKGDGAALLYLNRVSQRLDKRAEGLAQAGADEEAAELRAVCSCIARRIAAQGGGG